MNNYRSLSDKRNASWIMQGFALLFVIFAFTYLLTSGNDVVAAVSAIVYAKTALFLLSIHWIVALALTLCFWLIQPLVRTLYRAKVNRIVVTYIPAFIVMFVFMVIGRKQINNPHVLLWLGASVLILDFVLLWIYIFVRSLRKIDPRHYSTTGIYHYLPWVIVNIFSFAALTFAVVLGVSACSSVSFWKYHSEDTSVKAIVDSVKNIPHENKSDVADLEKTIAFNTRLSAQHKLGDSLFCFVQKFKSTGLGHKDTYSSATKDSITYDYHLAGLLLDRNLKAFYEDLKHYHEFHTDSFPAHYTEAFIMYKYLNPKLHLKIRNPYFNLRFKRYLKYGKHPKSQKFEFGKTFWWYYEHQK